uniref:G-protein coupled receptors family 1 profile domain-containing protein n=1 Tax=Panagrolaimus sp. PS1159 TaxID=55785 RepID=A0AC35GR49_9BILA
MIILATIERYLITVKSPNLNYWRQHRGGLALGMLGIALILRGTEIFEYTFARNGNCTELSEFEPVLTELIDDYVYGTLFRFYLRNIFTVFVPFFLLGYLNLNIVNTLRKQHRSAAMFRFGSSEHKLKIRSATRLLVLVVFSYLIANVLNVMITAWEYIDFKSTQTEVAFEIYEVLTDVISVLYVFTCASRLFIYLLCNQEIRNAFYESLCPQGLTLLTNEPQNEYKSPQQVNKVAVSLQQSQLGTDFDRLAIALVSPRISSASSTQKHVTEFLLKESKKHQQQPQRNGNYHSIENSVIIENPLAKLDDDENIPFYDD